MVRILNITNGDSAVAIMQKANIPGDFLPWRDVLHDGPVPQGLPLQQLSEVRADFITGRHWGEAESIRQQFIERDNVLKSYEHYDKVMLWFEHDLYDQLQLIQILDWFHQNQKANTAISMICEANYLGMLSPEQMTAHLQHERPVTELQLQLACTAWHAFRSPTPEKWFDLLESDTSALPFLQGAVVRMLEEYPSCFNGLSRTAHKALSIIAEEAITPGKLFTRYQETEERRFLGDSSFWVILNQLLQSSPALIHSSDGNAINDSFISKQILCITDTGRQVLSGKRHWLDLITLDHWIGGVHLTFEQTWCWNSNQQIYRLTNHHHN